MLDEENVLYIREINQWPSRFEADAENMTRDAKRGGKGSHPMIDDDMLPPRYLLNVFLHNIVILSESDCSDEEDCEDEDDEDEEMEGIN